jgi:hypothetical protein
VAGVTVLTSALVTCLKTFKVFLGFDWLQAVNPMVDWHEQTILVPEGMEVLPMRKLDDKTLTPCYKELFLKVFLEESFTYPHKESGIMQ